MKHTQPDLDEYLTVAEAAKVLRVSKTSLNRWRVSGFGPRYIKIVGRICYAKKDLAAFMAAKVRNSTSDSSAA